MTQPKSPRNRPIGVFDSGMGGLTVMRALMARLPNESFVYLGDTARLPYGTKSADTVIRYARARTSPWGNMKKASGFFDHARNAAAMAPSSSRVDRP